MQQIFQNCLFKLCFYLTDGQKENHGPLDLGMKTSAPSRTKEMVQTMNPEPPKPKKRPSIFGNVAALAETSRNPFPSPSTPSTFRHPSTPLSALASQVARGCTNDKKMRSTMLPFTPYSLNQLLTPPPELYFQPLTQLTSPMQAASPTFRPAELCLDPLTPPPTPTSSMSGLVRPAAMTHLTSTSLAPPRTTNRSSSGSPALPHSPAFLNPQVSSNRRVYYLSVL